MDAPKLARLAGPPTGDCGKGDCPTISATDRDTIAVQGYTLPIPAQDGETVVEIPKDLLREAVLALGW